MILSYVSVVRATVCVFLLSQISSPAEMPIVLMSGGGLGWIYSGFLPSEDSWLVREGPYCPKRSLSASFHLCLLLKSAGSMIRSSANDPKLVLLCWEMTFYAGVHLGQRFISSVAHLDLWPIALHRCIDTRLHGCWCHSCVDVQRYCGICGQRVRERRLKTDFWVNNI